MQHMLLMVPFLNKSSHFFFEHLSSIFIETRIVIGKRIELELKATDKKRLNQTISDLCNELSPDDLWLKCTHGKHFAIFQLK